MFNLPRIFGSLVPEDARYITYFSCDYKYFDRHGYALQQSINRTLSWMHVHCHIINEGDIDHTALRELSKLHRFTYTWEDVSDEFYINLKKNHKRMKDGMDIFKTSDINYIARRTYLASVRFMRLKELFLHKHQHILQIDCDSILRNGFHQSAFQELTQHVGVMPKPKDTGVFIASAITLGTNNDGLEFRQLFSEKMIEGFEDGCYWFIDQDVLKNVIVEWAGGRKKPFNKIPYKWNAWGMKRDEIFSTGKGSKKEDRKFKAAQLRWLPEHWRQKIEIEIRNLENVK